jgi:ubiquinone/menaquinone biosynthesis C-methylase UbiE
VTTSAIADAYSLTGAAWDTGPRRIYRQLADVLLDGVPGGVGGRDLLDVGAGTGVVGESARERDAAKTVALDTSIGILRVAAETRPPAVVGDALGLPFAADSFDVVIAAFSFNHVTDPAAAFAEAARVLRPGGDLSVAAYAARDTHPSKQIVDQVCRRHGWTAPPWYVDVQRRAIPLLATPSDALRHAGLDGAIAAVVDVPIADVGPHELVDWRLGMAHVAPFLASLPPADRDRLRGEALLALPADVPPLVRSIVVVSWSNDSRAGDRPTP